MSSLRHGYSVDKKNPAIADGEIHDHLLSVVSSRKGRVGCDFAIRSSFTFVKHPVW